MKEPVHAKVLLEEESAVLERVLDAYAPGADEPPAPPMPVPLVGECVDDRHPTLSGRGKVKWTDQTGRQREHWLPTLITVTVRVADRVLLQQPGNWDEPIIVGVLDGFSKRPAPEPGGPRLELPKDEAIHVVTRDGKPLLRIREGKAGPEVRILDESLELALPGKLRMSAAQIELAATAGNVKIDASGDVDVTGEVINLN